MNENKLTNREKYPHELHYPWLIILLDSYYICDNEVKVDVAIQETITKRKIACHKGCCNCCLRSDVLLSQIELQGISWFVSEIMDYESQNKLKPRLENHRRSMECPFLIENMCSIYFVRPLSCRHFLVYNKPCDIDEDVLFSRPNDIYLTPKDIVWKVARRLMDFEEYECSTEETKREKFDQGVIFQNSRSLHKIDWNCLISLIEYFQYKRK